MVTIIDFVKRTNHEGQDFVTLIVQGGIDMVASKTTGKFYATARKCSIPSTFEENTCKALIGQKIPGSIKKIPCEPYEFLVRQTGEVIVLEHQWEYSPEADDMKEVIFEGQVQQPINAPKPVFV